MGDDYTLQSLFAVVAEQVFNTMETEMSDINIPESFNQKSWINEIKMRVDKSIQEISKGESQLMREYHQLFSEGAYNVIYENLTELSLELFNAAHFGEKSKPDVLVGPESVQEIPQTIINTKSMVGHVKKYSRQRAEELGGSVFDAMRDEITTVYEVAQQAPKGSKLRQKQQIQFNTAADFNYRLKVTANDSLNRIVSIIERQSFLITLQAYLIDAMRYYIASEKKSETLLPYKELVNTLNRITERMAKKMKVKTSAVINIDSDRFLVLAQDAAHIYVADYDELLVEKRAEIYSCPADVDCVVENEKVDIVVRQCALDKMCVRASVCSDCPYGLEYKKGTNCMHETYMQAIASNELETPEKRVQIKPSQELDQVMANLEVDREIKSSNEAVTIYDSVVKKGSQLIGKVVDVNPDNSMKVLWENGQASIVWAIEVQKIEQ
jgi:hypothetical protein